MYAHAITVDPVDIDHMGHVNNAVYLRWVQDAVVRYWEAVAPAEAVAQHLWVALKHEISYRRPAFLEDGDPVADRSHLACVMGDQKDGPAAALKLDDPLEALLLECRVPDGEDLVHEQDVRP